MGWLGSLLPQVLEFWKILEKLTCQPVAFGKPLALSRKIRQNREMKVYCLIRSQTLPIPLDVAWAFFANPANVGQITPEWVHLRDESYELCREIYPGLLRIYQLKPFGLLKYRWVSEITHVEPMAYFVETQKLGPFALWQHKLLMEAVSNGVEIRDVIHYALPGGLGGDLAALLVRSQLERVWDYREQMLDEFFG